MIFDLNLSLWELFSYCMDKTIAYNVSDSNAVLRRTVSYSRMNVVIINVNLSLQELKSLLSRWQTNDKIGRFYWMTKMGRLLYVTRPILSADISAINLAVELVLISLRISGNKIVQFYCSSVIGFSTWFVLRWDTSLNDRSMTWIWRLSITMSPWRHWRRQSSKSGSWLVDSRMVVLVPRSQRPQQLLNLHRVCIISLLYRLYSLSTADLSMKNCRLSTSYAYTTGNLRCRSHSVFCLSKNFLNIISQKTM